MQEPDYDIEQQKRELDLGYQDFMHEINRPKWPPLWLLLILLAALALMIGLNLWMPAPADPPVCYGASGPCLEGK